MTHRFQGFWRQTQTKGYNKTCFPNEFLAHKQRQDQHSEYLNQRFRTFVFFLNVSLSQFLFKWSPDLFVEKTNCKETRQFGIFQQNRAIYTNINIMDWTDYHILTNLEFSDIRDIKGYSSLTYTFPYGEKLVPQRVHDQLVDLLTFNESNGAEVMTMRGCFTWGMKEGPWKVVYGV